MNTINEEKVIDAIKQCFDPEIPIDLWSLGLIYKIDIGNDTGTVDITMTLTTPGCGMAGIMADDVKTKVEAVEGVNAAKVDIVFDPVWTPEMMSHEARQKLGFSPPAENDKNWE